MFSLINAAVKAKALTFGGIFDFQMRFEIGKVRLMGEDRGRME